MNTTHLTPLGKLALLVAGLTLTGVVGAAGAAATRPHAQDWRCAIVRPGDTLWGLASSSGGDTRAKVSAMIAENKLESAGLQPGMAIWVPVGTNLRGSEADPADCARPAGYN